MWNRTLPAGYMEIGESAAEGAIRETWEEACAEVEVLSPFAQLDIPRIGQVRKINIYIYLLYLSCVLPTDFEAYALLCGQTYVIFLAKLRNPYFSPGPESSDCQLFALDDIPFDSLAFSSILVTLKLVKVLTMMLRCISYDRMISGGFNIFKTHILDCSTFKMLRMEGQGSTTVPLIKGICLNATSFSSKHHVKYFWYLIIFTCGKFLKPVRCIMAGLDQALPIFVPILWTIICSPD